MASFQNDGSQQGMQRMQQDMQHVTGLQKGSIQDLQQMQMGDMDRMKQMHQQMLLQQQMAEQKGDTGQGRIIDLADDLNNMMAEGSQLQPPINTLQMQGQTMPGMMPGMPMPMHPEMEKRMKKNDGYLAKVPEFLRDPLIVAIVYIVLSQPAVLGFFANYIPQLKVADGGVSTVGIIIYAVIVAAVFGVLKYFLNR